MAAPSDPLFASQWHLSNAGGVDLNVLPVWDPGSGPVYTGAGVSVLIFDAAVEIDPLGGHVHSDLEGNYATDGGGNFLHLTIGGVTYAPAPIDRSGTNFSDAHGIQVAGILAAERNGEGGVGVAYDVTFTVAPILRSDTPAPTVGALERSVDFDITNHSWGFQIDFEDNFDAAGWSGFAAALETSTTAGRNGLGTVNVTSAGNDRQDGSDTNYHSFENSRFTITVAAADETGSVASYSRPGANILVSGLSDDGSGNGTITTTDLLGPDGENPAASPDGDYTSGFGGTSAAAPQVSGIVALMLEANPALGWRDVQDILAYSARHTGSPVGGPPAGNELYSWSFNGATDWNLGGLHFSNDYGFGLVDARAAVRLAESWTLQSMTANAVDGGTFATGQILAVPDGGQAQLPFSYGGSVRTGSAEITLTIEPFGSVDHQPGDLSLVLVSPSGTESTIFNRPGFHTSGDPDGAETFFGGSETLTFTFRSEAFRGEHSQGTWTLRAEDHNANGLQAVITGITFTAHGGLPRTDDVYVFTDEFGTAAAPHGAGGAVTLTDGGGIDTLNAAAVSGAVDIDLGRVRRARSLAAASISTGRR